MVTVAEAEHIIFSQSGNFGTEFVSFEECLGRVLAENIVADRDFPPFDRVTMDGIAINFHAFKNGNRSFKIKATQSAGEPPVDISGEAECIEIMTGAVLPVTTNAVIPYEEIEISEGIATLNTSVVSINQNIHLRGKDKEQNEVLVKADQFITPVIVSIAASVGKEKLLVKRRPGIIIISTGDELVDIHQAPADFQIRRSNNYTLRATLQQHLLPAELLHLPDERAVIDEQLRLCVHQYDIILLSGGVSMGKFDFVPAALEKLQVKKLFHKVQQRPGKPFWFGIHPNGTFVFAFPGNPVSTFLCFQRYFLPWLINSFQVENREYYAILNDDVVFKPSLQYFLQVKLQINVKGELLATPVNGNGSGDFVHLMEADAFMELPLERSDFNRGEVFRVWPFKPTFF